jgi:hypothetical protein
MLGVAILIGLFLGIERGERHVIIVKELLYILLLVVTEKNADGNLILLQGGEGFFRLAYQGEVAFIILGDDTGFVNID